MDENSKKTSQSTHMMSLDEIFPVPWERTPEQRQVWEDYLKELSLMGLKPLTDEEIDRNMESTPPQEGEPGTWNPTSEERERTLAEVKAFFRRGKTSNGTGKKTADN